jgi:hypothetical protein
LRNRGGIHEQTEIQAPDHSGTKKTAPFHHSGQRGGAPSASFFPGRSLLSYHRMQNELARLAARNQALEKRNRELAAEIERLKTDDAYLEEVARKKYGLLRDDEEVFDFSHRNGKRGKK